MKVKTGNTIYELVMSVDTNNNPVSGATFDTSFYIDGVITSSIIPSISLINASGATFSVTWSASTYGFHQLHMKNALTNVIFVSNLYEVLPDVEVDPSPTIYVGL
jgi:hypothetical protein